MKKIKREKGQSLVEFALLVPVLLIILAGVLDLGRLYYVYVTITDAASEGATYAAIHPEDSDEICVRAQEASRGLVQIEEADQVEVEYSSLTAGAPVTVTVNYPYKVLTPFMNVIVPDGVLQLRAVATEVILTGETGD
jgi:Flp pilus assembly protein TadG